MGEKQEISRATIARLSVYSRYLQRALVEGKANLSSAEIAEGVNGTATQVRKDLGQFGRFGKKGLGYPTEELNEAILDILGLTKRWKTVLVGAGNLGSALSCYQGFEHRGFDIVAVFDNDLNKVGLRLNGLLVYPLNQLEEYIREHGIELGIIAVPASQAQGVADQFVRANVKGILNLAPIALSTVDEVEYIQHDISVPLEMLSSQIRQRLKGNA